MPIIMSRNSGSSSTTSSQQSHPIAFSLSDEDIRRLAAPGEFISDNTIDYFMELLNWVQNCDREDPTEPTELFDDENPNKTSTYIDYPIRYFNCGFLPCLISRVSAMASPDQGVIAFEKFVRGTTKYEWLQYQRHNQSNEEEEGEETTDDGDDDEEGDFSPVIPLDKADSDKLRSLGTKVSLRQKEISVLSPVNALVSERINSNNNSSSSSFLTSGQSAVPSGKRRTLLSYRMGLHDSSEPLVVQQPLHTMRFLYIPYCLKEVHFVLFVVDMLDATVSLYDSLKVAPSAKQFEDYVEATMLPSPTADPEINQCFFAIMEFLTCYHQMLINLNEEAPKSVQEYLQARKGKTVYFTGQRKYYPYAQALDDCGIYVILNAMMSLPRFNISGRVLKRDADSTLHKQLFPETTEDKSNEKYRDVRRLKAYSSDPATRYSTRIADYTEYVELTKSFIVIPDRVSSKLARESLLFVLKHNEAYLGRFFGVDLNDNNDSDDVKNKNKNNLVSFRTSINSSFQKLLHNGRRSLAQNPDFLSTLHEWQLPNALYQVCYPYYSKHFNEDEGRSVYFSNLRAQEDCEAMDYGYFLRNTMPTYNKNRQHHTIYTESTSRLAEPLNNGTLWIKGEQYFVQAMCSVPSSSGTEYDLNTRFAYLHVTHNPGNSGETPEDEMYWLRQQTLFARYYNSNYSCSQNWMNQRLRDSTSTTQVIDLDGDTTSGSDNEDDDSTLSVNRSHHHHYRRSRHHHQNTKRFKQPAVRRTPHSRRGSLGETRIGRMQMQQTKNPYKRLVRWLFAESPTIRRVSVVVFMDDYWDRYQTPINSVNRLLEEIGSQLHSNTYSSSTSKNNNNDEEQQQNKDYQIDVYIIHRGLNRFVDHTSGLQNTITHPLWMSHNYRPECKTGDGYLQQFQKKKRNFERNALLVRDLLCLWNHCSNKNAFLKKPFKISVYSNGDSDVAKLFTELKEEDDSPDRNHNIFFFNVSRQHGDDRSYDWTHQHARVQRELLKKLKRGHQQVHTLTLSDQCFRCVYVKTTNKAFKNAAQIKSDHPLVLAKGWWIKQKSCPYKHMHRHSPYINPKIEDKETGHAHYMSVSIYNLAS